MSWRHYWHHTVWIHYPLRTTQTVHIRERCVRISDYSNKNFRRKQTDKDTSTDNKGHLKLSNSKPTDRQTHEMDKQTDRQRDIRSLMSRESSVEPTAWLAAATTNVFWNSLTRVLYTTHVQHATEIFSQHDTRRRHAGLSDCCGRQQTETSEGELELTFSKFTRKILERFLVLGESWGKISQSTNLELGNNNAIIIVSNNNCKQ